MLRSRVMVGGVVFLSAFLLFLGEPMLAKQLLPVLGGSSAVWVTCLVFFQAMLLAGYAYAYWIVRLSGPRRSLMHMVLLAASVAVLCLPLWRFLGTGVFRMLLPTGPLSAMHPVLTIFLALGVPVGLPFVVLGSTSPLLQVLVARHQGGPVPYRLFGLSNVGSLLALLAYPFFVEPRLTLNQQCETWLAGFLVFLVLSGWIVTEAGKSVRNALDVFPDQALANSPKPLPVADSSSRATRWLWFLLPMGAAMQLSAVTSHLSQDIAAIPLLWVLPLGVYLVTFVLAFDAPWLYRRWIVSRLLLVLLASLGYALSKVDTRLPVDYAVLFYLAEVFVACWFCHAEVYQLRPVAAEQSAGFYLLVAAGGVAGTFLIAIASPLIFRSNYDLAFAFLTIAALAAIVTWREGWAQRMLWITGCALLLGLTMLLHVQFGRQALLRARNFYGSLRVIESGMDDTLGIKGMNRDGSASTGTGPVRVLMNGRIRHGMQMLEADRRRLPTSYYGEDSGVGVALRNCCEGRTKNVGVVGLGVGTVAAYGQPGDHFRFYEINPLVEPIARNLFTFLRDSQAAISVANGDARVSLSREAPQNYDVLVVDAFSGDAIPLHLLTREALEIYRWQLAPGGVVAFHVSNTFLRLAPEIRRVAESEGMQARVVESMDVPSEGAYRATWVLVSASSEFFDKPAVAAVAMRIPEQPGLRVWTDDYSSLLSVLRAGD